MVLYRCFQLSALSLGCHVQVPSSVYRTVTQIELWVVFCHRHLVADVYWHLQVYKNSDSKVIFCATRPLLCAGRVEGGAGSVVVVKGVASCESHTSSCKKSVESFWSSVSDIMSSISLGKIVILLVQL